MDRLPSIAQSRRKESVVNHLEIELAGSECIPIHCPFHLHSINRDWNKLRAIKTSVLTPGNNTNVPHQYYTKLKGQFSFLRFIYPGLIPIK